MPGYFKAPTNIPFELIPDYDTGMKVEGEYEGKPTKSFLWGGLINGEPNKVYLPEIVDDMLIDKGVAKGVKMSLLKFEDGKRKRWDVWKGSISERPPLPSQNAPGSTQAQESAKTQPETKTTGTIKPSDHAESLEQVLGIKPKEKGFNVDVFQRCLEITGQLFIKSDKTNPSAEQLYNYSLELYNLISKHL